MFKSQNVCARRIPWHWDRNAVRQGKSCSAVGLLCVFSHSPAISSSTIFVRTFIQCEFLAPYTAEVFNENAMSRCEAQESLCHTQYLRVVFGMRFCQAPRDRPHRCLSVCVCVSVSYDFIRCDVLTHENFVFVSFFCPLSPVAHDAI